MNDENLINIGERTTRNYIERWQSFGRGKTKKESTQGLYEAAALTACDRL